MTGIPQLEDSLTRLHLALSGLGLRYALIGGAAVVLRGYDRATNDIDAVVLGADDRLPEILLALAECGLVLRRPEGLAFAKQHRVILLRTDEGTEADVSMGLLPFEIELVDRATLEFVGAGTAVPVATPEDLVIMKLIASRDRDREDVRRLHELYPDLNVSRIRSIVSEYAAILEQPEIIQFLDTVFG